MTTVIEAVNQITNDARERLALLIGALLEGGSLGSSGFGVGDNGTSFGPYQIHLPAHPGVTSAQAQDVSFATRYMYPSYKTAVRNVPDSLWQSNPIQAAARAAYIAERPRDVPNNWNAQYSFYSYPAARVSSAWNTLTGALKSNVPLSDIPSSSPASASVLPAGIPDWLDPRNWPGVGGAFDAGAAFVQALAKVFDPHLWWRIFFVIGGLGLMGLGLALMNGKTVVAVGKTAGLAAAA